MRAELYLDLALMRIIEPTSRLRSIELLELHFQVTYAKRTLYSLLPTVPTSCTVNPGDAVP